LVNLYHRFIPGCADKLHPLNEFFYGQSWKDNTIATFTAIKEATLLPHTQTSIIADASDITVGNVLQQCNSNKW